MGQKKNKINWANSGMCGTIFDGLEDKQSLEIVIYIQFQIGSMMKESQI